MSDMKKLLEAVSVQDEVITESILAEDDAAEIAGELEEIRDQIKALAYEAMDLASSSPSVSRRSKAYWFPQLLQALDSDNEYMGSSQYSMQDAIEELTEEGAPYDQD